MTKHASILGRELSISVSRLPCWGVPCVPKILVMGQSNGSNSALNNNYSLLLFVWEFHGTF